MVRDYIFADAHLLDGSKADNCDYKPFDEMIASYESDDEAGDLIGVGDSLDCTLLSSKSVIQFNKERFGWISDILIEKNRCLYLIRGNHDWWLNATDLMAAGLINTVLLTTHTTCGYQIEHGNRFDWEAHGVMLYVGAALTRVSGTIRKRIPSFDDNFINPENYISAARKAAQDTEHPTQRNANMEAERLKKNLIIGHSHHPCIVNGHDWSCSNPGSITETKTYLILERETRKLIPIGAW